MSQAKTQAAVAPQRAAPLRATLAPAAPAAAAAPALGGAPWVGLQQRLGNRALAALLNAPAPPDPLELAADRYAEHCAGDPAGYPADGAQPPAGASRPRALVAAPRRALPWPGQPLPAALRLRLESQLGVDLRPVRLHTDAAAATLAGRLGARAFALGSDIAFGRGVALASAAGATLLAHEVAHVAQQARGQRAPASPLQSTLADIARLLGADGSLALQRQPDPAAAAGAAADADSAAVEPVPDDAAFDTGIDAALAPDKNRQWWKDLGFDRVSPLRELDPWLQERAYANHVRRAQERLRTAGVTRIEGGRIGADGILGPRTFLALLAVARDPAHAARADIQGLGFDLDAIAAADNAELAARAYAHAPSVLLQATVQVHGVLAMRFYERYYAMRTAGDQDSFDHAMFADNPPPGLRREDRIEILRRLYASGDGQLAGVLELVQVDRDFIHNRLDVASAVEHDRRRGVDRRYFFNFAATSPERVGVMVRDLGLESTIEHAEARLDAGGRVAEQAGLALIAKQVNGTVTGAAQAAGLVLALYLPAVDEARRSAVTGAVLAERAERERVELERIEASNREAAHQRADALVALIDDDDTYHIVTDAALEKQLERAARERQFFDLVLDDLATRPGNYFNRLFERAEAVSGEYAIGQLVLAARAGRYRDNARVRDCQRELARRHGGVREHAYEVDAGGDATRGAVLLDGDERVRVGQVCGDVTSAYLRDEDREQLKPEPQRLFEAQLQTVSQAYMDSLLSGNEKARTQEEIGKLLMERAWAAANLDTDRDIEDVEWQESVRVHGVRLAADRGDGVARYEVEYERVQRIVGGMAGDTPWAAVDGSRHWGSESDFEYDMFWYAYSQSADVMLAFAKVVLIGSVLVIAWEVGLIAALVEAGGGALVVGTSIAASMAIYLFTHERWTLEGLLVAGVEGYLGALGFRLFAPVGAAVGRLVIPATLEQVAFRRVVAAWLLRHGVTGALVGGTLGPASLLMQDLIRVAGTGGGFSSFASYLRAAGTGMLLGAVFEIGGSALLSPLFRNADASVLARVDDVVTTLNGSQPRLTPSQWMSEVATSLSGTLEHLKLIMAETQARGIYAVLAERVKAVGSAWLRGARATLHREIIEMAGAKLSREGLDGLERLLRLGSAHLGDDALATMLQQARRTPERIDPWLRFLSGVDDSAVTDIAARSQLQPLLQAEQALALAARRTATEVHGLLGSRFGNVVADLDAFATRLNRLKAESADRVLEALHSRGNAVTPSALVRAVEAGHALDDEVLGGMQRLLDGAADRTRLDAVLERMADDQVGSFLRQAHGAAAPELDAMRRVVATHDAALVAWGVRLPIHDAEALLNSLSAPARTVITDITAAEAQGLVTRLGIDRVNRALGGGTAGPMRGAHLLALEQGLQPRSALDVFDSAGTSKARLGRAANVAAGLGPAAARLPATPLAAGSLMLDSNARSAVDELVRGVSKDGKTIAVYADLDANYQAAIDAIRESRGLPRYVDPPGGARPTVEQVVGSGADLRAPPVAGAESVTSEALSGRASSVMPQMGGVRPNRAHADYGAVVDELRARAIGGPGGAVDRVVVADALFAETAAGAVPRLVTVDTDVATRLAEHFGVAPRRFAPLRGQDRWQALVERYPEGSFTIDILHHRLEIAFHGNTHLPPVPP